MIVDALERMITITAAETASEDEFAWLFDDGDAIDRLMVFILEEYGEQPPEIWQAISAKLNAALLHAPRGPGEAAAMTATTLDYKGIKALAKELRRPASTLYALSHGTDPFFWGRRGGQLRNGLPVSGTA